MRKGLGGESAQDLLALARARGFRITRTQLARWHRSGLLPLPERRFLGRGRGALSVYPLDTGMQLLALCEVRAQERRFSRIAWKLWWAGYDTPTVVVRRLLSQIAVRWERFLRALVKEGEPSEYGLAFLERLEAKRLNDKGLRQLRRRVGKRRFSTFVLLLLQLVSGTFKDWRDEDDPKILSRGLGLPPADQLPSESAWLLDATSQREANRVLHPAAFRKALEQTAEDALLRARDEARILLSSVSLVSLGLGTFRDSFASEPLSQMAFLLVWLVRRPGIADQAGSPVARRRLRRPRGVRDNGRSHA